MEETPAKPIIQGAERTRTVITAGAVVLGDIEGPTDLHVQGRVVGGITVTGLVLDVGAEIDGSVAADAVVLGGRVTGKVNARAVHVQATARVDADLTYTNLQIDPGARLSGQLIAAEGMDITKTSGARGRPARARSGATDPGQELVRMAARLRRAAE